MATLIVAQEYELKTLIKTCVYDARRLSFKELKHHSKQGEIKPENYIQVTERIIELLEKEKEQEKHLANRTFGNRTLQQSDIIELNRT